MSRVVSVRTSARLVSLAALGVDLLAWNWDGSWRWGDSLGSPVFDAAMIGGLLLAHGPAILRPDRVWWAAGTLWVYGLAVGLLSTDFSPFAGICVALCRLVAVVPQRAAVSALAAVSVPFGLNAFNTRGELLEVSNPLVVTVPIWAALAIIPWGIGRASYRASQRADERTRERERQKDVEAREQLQAERLRLARELHDIVSHSVSAMTLQAAGARALAPDGDPRQLAALEAVEQTGVQAMRELHRLLGLLRTADDGSADAATEWSGRESIRHLDALLDTVRASDVEVELVTQGTPRDLDPSIDHAAYRVVQEALANVVKHGGRAASARVSLAWLDTVMRLDIRNTTGLTRADAAAELSGGLGLRGLAERVELVGGRFEAGPAGDGGYIVRTELPFAPATASPTSVSPTRTSPKAVVRR